ncbi:hypothetical protein F5883DRAFT_607619 [Diaporthe sp. PMI_573]|nr:hypothetical protein F5883DRAFT_607619 [Diaporthaceae sp. PMI_573]
MDFIDVAIISGGPVGLTVANTLARQVHTAGVYDNNSYRNSGANHMHMVLTWDHKNPQKYRAAARKNIQGNCSTIEFASVAVDEIDKESDSHFEVHDSNGDVKKFRKVILAVGLSNIFPGIGGYAELWKRRIFHCLFCHGYEDRGAPSSGVLEVQTVNAAIEAHMAQNAAEEVLGAQTPNTIAQGPFVAQLGLATAPLGDIQADGPFYRTNVLGVYAIGGCSTPYRVTPSYITSGCDAAVTAAAEIKAAKSTRPPCL